MELAYLYMNIHFPKKDVEIKCLSICLIKAQSQLMRFWSTSLHFHTFSPDFCCWLFLWVFCVRFLLCFAVLCVLSSFAIISLGKCLRAGYFTFVVFWMPSLLSFFDFSSWCHGLVCNIWLCHFLVILTYFLWNCMFRPNIHIWGALLNVSPT